MSVTPREEDSTECYSCSEPSEHSEPVKSETNPCTLFRFQGSWNVSEKYSDIQIIAGDVSFAAHKVVLSLRWAKFE